MSNTSERISTGLVELDPILFGGFIKQSSYLIRGGPGQGKTTLGLHFLSAANPQNSALFIGFQETEEQLRANAKAVGIDVSNIHFLRLSPDEHFFTDQQGYDVFAAADVEQEPLAQSIIEAVERALPTHVFIDSMTQLRFLSADIYQYRKQVLSFLRYFRERGATVLFTSELSTELPDDDLQFIADGVITLDTAPTGSFIQVSKFRGSNFLRGPHQVRLGHRGLEVFPRPLPPKANFSEDERWRWNTDIEKLDEILGGGLEAGTISLITGPSGIGKSTLASLFVARAAAQGRKAAVYLFDEELSALLHRASSLKINLKEPLTDGRLSIEQVEPLRYLTDEFARLVMRKVEEEDVELVVLDSIAGFELTLGGSHESKTAIHALAKSLSRRGASVLLVNEVQALVGQFRISERGISYLSDNVIFMRFMEVEGELKKLLGVLKKRLSAFDTRVYTYEIGPTALSIGAPVGKQGWQNVLGGQQAVHE
ncbi:ATPase domain-containing protein [Nitrosococcus wardiae]|uniref:non-specific serine/threonine protein kinase n=1 Tax=Nitrosococcus wardiae TaxID=1814290 RepID=A0A4P7C2K5_9GAMM|nr:ATPase domain-containing protein [Nitrosococcus wardiae]QBQ55917.1 circadian clock protein KaiC [Nitrosococcus wardiae]